MTKKLTQIEYDVIDYLVKHAQSGVLNLKDVERQLNIPLPIVMECIESLSEMGIIAAVFCSVEDSQMITFKDMGSVNLN